VKVFEKNFKSIREPVRRACGPHPEQK